MPLTRQGLLSRLSAVLPEKEDIQEALYYAAFLADEQVIEFA
jgi:hypothetical protein